MKIQNLIFKRIHGLFITHEYFNEEEEQKCNIILIVLKNIFLIYVLILMKISLTYELMRKNTSYIYINVNKNISNIY